MILLGVSNIAISVLNSGLAGQTGDSIRSITDAVSTIRDMNTQIATAAEEQSTVSELIRSNVANVASLAQGAHSSAQHSTEIANNLDQTSDELSGLISRFKVPFAIMSMTPCAVA